MFKRILLAVDGSEHSIRSAKYAIGLTRQFEGAIDVIYVVDGKTAKEDVLHSTNKLEIEQKREEKLKPIIDLLDKSTMDYKTNVLHGDPGPVIVEFANERSYDCVVIGSRGLNDLQSFILGSVSHKVAKRVECPVLIVK
ncbi:universal stress protein [Virgibacillus salexigens]|uniref:universal stress protein n=1 Tax=Virgibacillus salexigens TaxID=61016 RepID=UPI00190A31CA|nr:universal stress protein [Virgibacillus salexigens]